MKTYSRVRAVIDLDAVEYNVKKMKENLQEDTRIIAVVKMDAYGHGAVPITTMLEKVDTVWGYAVATLDEGLILRNAGIEKPILCLGCVFPEQLEEMLTHQIRMTAFSEELAELASKKAVELGETVIFHVKVDTGMSRLGFPSDREGVEAIKKMALLPNVKLEGLFTHFAKADEADKEPTRKQLQRFQWMKEELSKEQLSFAYYHTANSAGIVDIKESNMELVRAGILTFGLYPSEEVEKSAVPLKPAMELITHVIQVKWIEAGAQVSYGGGYTAESRMRIATIPVGYGDGYPRSLSNKGYVLIRGKRAPILGRVCMDQFMVDVTNIENVSFGDEVVLVGRSGERVVSIDELSALSDRFNYEFVCDINKRVPREYIKNGRVVEQIDHFD